MNVCNNDFLYTAYADDTTFFLQNKKSATEVLNNFNIKSQFSGLKINKSKCEVAGTGVMKEVKVALCGVECVNLLTNAIKILGIYFSYNKKLENKKNFLDHITEIQKVVNIWKMPNLLLLGKITIFKTLALSKIIHLALVFNVPTATIELLSKMQKEFLWGKNKSEIKQDTLCNDYENGGLKSVDIFSKIVSLQCSWVRRLYDKNFHPWKVIPLYLIEMHFGKNFNFHPNLDLRNFSLKIFSKYYQEIIYRWGIYLSSPPSLPSSIASQFLWINKDIQIDNKLILFSNFSYNGINFVRQLFDSDGELHCWKFLKEKYLLSQS